MDSSTSEILSDSLDSVAWLLAHKIHKEGLPPKSKVTNNESFRRIDLYPDLYKSEEEINAALEDQVVDSIQVVEAPPTKRARLRLESATDEATDPSASAESMHNTRQQTSSYDIWGNCPPKEPKEPAAECPICHRVLSTLRFAPHLDKCMGLGLGSRAATSRNSAS